MHKFRKAGKLAREFSIDEDWINTEVENAFKLSRVPRSEWEWFDDFGRLTVYKVSDKVLLAMKVAAAREREDKSDLFDTFTLLKRMELVSYDEALEVIEGVREMTSVKAGEYTFYNFTLEQKNLDFLKKAVDVASRSSKKRLEDDEDIFEESNLF